MSRHMIIFQCEDGVLSTIMSRPYEQWNVSLLWLLSDDVNFARLCFGGITTPISSDAFSPWLVYVGLSQSEPNVLQIQQLGKLKVLI